MIHILVSKIEIDFRRNASLTEFSLPNLFKERIKDVKIKKNCRQITLETIFYLKLYFCKGNL